MDHSLRLEPQATKHCSKKASFSKARSFAIENQNLPLGKISNFFPSSRTPRVTLGTSPLSTANSTYCAVWQLSDYTTDVLKRESYFIFCKTTSYEMHISRTSFTARHHSYILLVKSPHWNNWGVNLDGGKVRKHMLTSGRPMYFSCGVFSVSR